MRSFLPLFLTLFAFGLGACSGAPVGGDDEMTVEAGCASCIYEMDGIDGCEPAVMLDGTPVLVSAPGFDAHEAGLCHATKTAVLAGEMEGERFAASRFELVD